MPEDSRFQATHTPFELSKYAGPYEAARVAILCDLLPEGQGRKAIDIGCGPGFFSRELSQRGWAVTGIDTDADNIARAQAFAHATIQADGVSALAQLPAAGHSLALMLEIIEHMPRSVGADLLREVHRVLQPGAQLLLSTPNRWSLEGLGGYYWGERVRGAGKWQAWDSTHVHIYSSAEIVALLRRVGFSVESVIGYYYQGRLPLLGKVGLPITTSDRFPMNRLGFNLMLTCRRH